MSAPMVAQQYPSAVRVPHRKPLPLQQSTYPTHANQPGSSSAQQQQYHDPSQTYPLQSQPSSTAMHNAYVPNPSTRRTLSNATSSTSSTTPSAHNSIRRSSSGRSTGPPPTSYVALLRKQKATVWCDRSQAEDPRIRVQQRMAKERAEREVAAGGSNVGRSTPPTGSNSNSNMGGSFTGGVARKIRHHGGKPVQYTGGNMAGAGVPMRLSATEVEDETDDRTRTSRQEEELNEWEHDPAWGYAGARPSQGQHHRRTGSGKSSLGSQRRATGSGYQPRFSTSSSTPTSGHSRSPSEVHLHDLAEEKTPHASARPGNDYFNVRKGNGKAADSDSSHSERENSFGGPAALPTRAKAPEPKETSEDLIRRGSVDERTMTIGRGVRLFVANPDLSD
ncbi:hypothetical protein FKW77_009930 [Venturia effusa]|uniref:Uncharacterized protein n=1 Tax=Venturia effusa TaxID=50376 RepID=A0A517L0D9_9PEZI|nr:hypothetical protein FKW77_009930 [Venturia effusa]